MSYTRTLWEVGVNKNICIPEYEDKSPLKLTTPYLSTFRLAKINPGFSKKFKWELIVFAEGIDWDLY